MCQNLPLSLHRMDPPCTKIHHADKLTTVMACTNDTSRECHSFDLLVDTRQRRKYRADQKVKEKITSPRITIIINRSEINHSILNQMQPPLYFLYDFSCMVEIEVDNVYN